MVTLDKIRLTGLLPRSPAQAGLRHAVAAGVAVAALALVPSTAAQGPPPPDARLPADPAATATAIRDTTASLTRAIDAWRASVRSAVPDDVTLYALYQQRIVRLLSRNGTLARATLRRLPRPSAAIVRDLVVAHRDLVRITPPLRVLRIHVGSPAPAANLLRWYREGQRRFGVPWQVLAAVNFVESAFGKLRSASAAGAQGPMQFMPSSWRTYGLGGDVHDPHDAILGAANYLRAAGAGHDIRQALHAYNPSRFYVDAVLRYARRLVGERHTFYALYSWQVFVRTSTGVRRVTGPGIG